MNISFVFQVIQFFMLYAVADLLAIIALRAVSGKSLRSTRLFEWNEEGETHRWQPLGLAASTGQFGWTWGKGFGPKWTRQDDDGNTVSVTVIGPDQFKPTDNLEDAHWLGKGNKYFLLVSPVFAVPMWLWFVDLVGVVLIVGAFLFAKSPERVVRVFAVSTPAATRAVSTPVATAIVLPTLTITPPSATCPLKNVDMALTAYPAGENWMRFSTVPQGGVGPGQCPVFTSEDQIALWDWIDKKWLILVPTNDLRRGTLWILNTRDPLSPIDVTTIDGKSGFILPLEEVEMQDGNVVYRNKNYFIPYATFYKQQQ